MLAQTPALIQPRVQITRKCAPEKSGCLSPSPNLTTLRIDWQRGLVLSPSGRQTSRPKWRARHLALSQIARCEKRLLDDCTHIQKAAQIDPNNAGVLAEHKELGAVTRR